MIALLAAAPLLAALASPYHAPRTPLGAPDLQGAWTNTSITMLQRPLDMMKALTPDPGEAAQVEAGFRQYTRALTEPRVDPNAPAPPRGREVPQADLLEMDMRLGRVAGKPRSSWIVEPADGQIPFTGAGRAAAARLQLDDYDGPEGRPTNERCLTAIGSPEGPPMMNAGFNGNYLIVQTRDRVAIEVEMNHDVRIVRLGDRSHPPASVRLWMGDSVGWWEGDTLVVETTNLDPRAGIDTPGGGFAYGPRTRVTERFTRTGPRSLLYAFAVEDPDQFTRPFRGEMPWRAAGGPIFEYACHEGNYSLPNALRGARVQELNRPLLRLGR